MANMPRKPDSGPFDGETSVTAPRRGEPDAPAIVSRAAVPIDGVPTAPVPIEGVPIDAELPLLIARAVKAMVAQVTEKAGPSPPGPTVVHAIAVRYLEGHDQVTTAELAAHLRVTKQSASEI